MGSFAHVAPELYDFGLNVMPAVGKRAVVAWKDWQTRRQTMVELRDLIRWHPEADPAVILGSGSGVVDLDIDDPCAERMIRQLGLPLPPTACFESKRGPHRLHRHDAPLPTRRNLLPGMDFLAQGTIVVVPPAAGRYWLLALEHIASLPSVWADLVLTSLTNHRESAREASSEYSLLTPSEGVEQFFRDWGVVWRVCAALGVGRCGPAKASTASCQVMQSGGRRHPCFVISPDV